MKNLHDLMDDSSLNRNAKPIEEWRSIGLCEEKFI
jgi:hypothetical protein